MNTDELINDARLMLDTIEQCHSPSFRQAAARQLAVIAAQLQSAVSALEPAQAEIPEDRPVIDLAMKYRTRDGREVDNLTKDGAASDYYHYWGEVGSQTRGWDKYGFYLDPDTESELDLIPTGEPA